VSVAIEIISGLLGIFSLILLIRAIMSWIPSIDPYHPIIRLIYRITDPILEPIRALIPPVGGMDISILIVFLVIYFLRQALASLR
jgi:YggT family protein